MAADVSSFNRFSLLVDPAAPPSTPPTTEKPKAEAPRGKTTQRGRSGPASRSGRYPQRGGGASQAPRDSAEATDDAPPQGRRFGEERGRGRGRGGRGRGYGGRGGLERPDRHSATGKVDSEKKISQGWGGQEGEKEFQAEADGSRDAAEAAAETPADDSWGIGDNTATTAAVDDAWGTTPAEGSGDTTKEAAPAETRRREEEEDNTLTLDQYQAQRKKELAVPKLENVRKPNDGDDEAFKNAVALKKHEEDAYFAGKSKTARQRKKAEEKRQAVVTDLEFNGPFRDAFRGGRGRGDRGGERGGERGGDRGGRGRGRGARGRGRSGDGAPVNLDDQKAFPALST